MGNLTAAPQSKEVGENTVCTFSVAINSISKKEEVFFVDVECWNKVAQNCQKYLDKGSKALIEGKLKLNSWTSKDGQKREKFICVADLVTFVSSSGAGKSSPQPSAATQVKQEDKELEDFEF
jgi:single-strand DNA-binding protein